MQISAHPIAGLTLGVWDLLKQPPEAILDWRAVQAGVLVSITASAEPNGKCRIRWIAADPTSMRLSNSREESLAAGALFYPDLG
jgi:hypothetical protein